MRCPALIDFATIVFLAVGLGSASPIFARNIVTVDHPKLTITITVPIQVVMPAYGRSRVEDTPDEVANFERALDTLLNNAEAVAESHWNSLLAPERYRGCYKFVVDFSLELAPGQGLRTFSPRDNYHVLVLDPGGEEMSARGGRPNITGGDPFAHSQTGYWSWRPGSRFSNVSAMIFNVNSIDFLRPSGFERADTGDADLDDHLNDLKLRGEIVGRTIQELRRRGEDPSGCDKLTRTYDYELEDSWGSTAAANAELVVVVKPAADGSWQGQATSTQRGWAHSPNSYLEYGASGLFEVTGQRKDDGFEMTLQGQLTTWDTIGYLMVRGISDWTIKGGPIRDGFWRDVVTQAGAIGDPDHGVRGIAPGGRMVVTSVLEEEEQGARESTGSPASPGSSSACCGTWEDKGVPELADLVNNGNFFDRRKAAGFLGDLGPQAEPAIDVLVQAAGDEDHRLQQLATRALGNIGPGARLATAHIETLLWHEQSAVRVAAASALWKIDGRADVLGVLTELLGSVDPSVAASAASALGDLGSSAKSATAQLRKMTEKTNAAVMRLNAATALWKVESQPDTAISALTDLLIHFDPTVRAQAASALGQMGRAAQPATSSLVAVLTGELKPPPQKTPPLPASIQAAPAGAEDGSTVGPPISRVIERDTILKHAADSVRQIEGDREAVPILLEAAKSNNIETYSATVQALGDAGADAVPLLLAALRDKDERVRGAAAIALRRIGPRAQDQIDMITTALGTEDTSVRAMAISLLGDLGGDARGSLSELHPYLSHEQVALRLRAAEAVWNISGGTDQVLGVLNDTMKQDDPALRGHAAHLLARMGPAAAPSVAALAERLRDADFFVRHVAAYALGEIGPAARPAMPALEQTQADKTTHVRAAASESLTKIKDDGNEGG